MKPFLKVKISVRRIVTVIHVLMVFLLPEKTFTQSIARIEPPNWWIGMKNPVVQIMLYGNDIGGFSASTKTKGVKVLRTSCPGNKNYLFIDLQISPKTKPGNLQVKLTDDHNNNLSFSYSLHTRLAHSAQRNGYTNSDVIYLLTPDRFANGDAGNDDVAGMKEAANRNNKDGRHGGDIKGISNHIKYIADLGATALWLNPVLENDMPAWSYHGYATTDFYKVDARMGTNESFKQLTAQANSLGIKMIMDMIHNHCGSHHWWMTDLPSADWVNYNNAPYTQTNHQKTLHPDMYASPEDLRILEDGWFVTTMPDLNVNNEYLANYLITNSLWWIEYASLSGIRMDTYLYPESTYMSRWAKRVMEEYPNFNITGEVWYDQPDFVAYWQRGKMNSDGYVSFLPSLFDFPLHHGIIQALTHEEGWNTGWRTLYEMLAKDFQYPDPNNLVTFVDNHDMSRIYAQLDGDVAKMKMALAFVMTMRGIPQLYYGTEIMMNSPNTRDDGAVRADFPGGWDGDDVNAFTGAGLTGEQTDMKTFVTKLLNWRKTADVVHEGKTMHYIPENGIYVIFRYTATQTLMVILNKNQSPVQLDISRFATMMRDAVTGTDILTGKTIDLSSPIKLEQAGPLIISFN